MPLLIWVILSGIGSFLYQNSDFTHRNPIYHDLCNYNWPVLYNLSQSSVHAALSYYFSWWLPPALIAKIFALGYTGQELLLYFWSMLYITCADIFKKFII